MSTAVVVGSGPNGLAGAVRLAQAGLSVTVVEARDRIGGGTRTSQLTVPGVLHDDCSAFHPSGVASPFLRSLGLEREGLRWRWPEIDVAHPLDDGRAGVLSRDLDRTVASLGVDGPRWRAMFEPLVADFDRLVADVFGPILHVPRHPTALARFGLASLPPATWTARRFRDQPARGLFGGVAAHAFGRLDVPVSGAVGVLLAASAHAVGWPVAEGGSGAIAAALAGRLRSLGGVVETGRPVRALDELRDASGRLPDVVLLDVAPDAAVRIVADLLPPRVRRWLLRYRYGPAAYKVDYAIEGDVPWTNDDCRRAGTVHVGGTMRQIAAAEAAVVRGQLPPRPFVLVGQQYLADPSRSVGSINPVWTYAHVPHGWAPETGADPAAIVTRQLERFAPGFAERVVATHVRSAPELQRYNPNYVGGDIGTGANSLRQLVFRPRPTTDPYGIGVPGVYLCSAATPPGGGVHGMGGFHAAQRALAGLR